MEEMKTNEFRNFDVVSKAVSDHRFFKSTGGNIKDNPNSITHNRIMKEWKTLKQNLPESIYVRVYKNRIDLMRVAIVGAAGTPYHDGLFFFDIAFPSDYPNNPPMASFISFRLRLNPNLHVNGKVNLSLLSKCEIVEENCEAWDPSESTSLQVLLSLQKLVLNEELFRRFHMDDDSLHTYNEKAYILTFCLALNLMLTPPMDFKGFVMRHFRDRAPAILMAFKEYASGSVSVGNYGRIFSLPVKVSSEFKEYAHSFYPMMLKAFQLCDASLDASFHNLELSSQSSHQRGIKKSGILKKFKKVIKSWFVSY